MKLQIPMYRGAVGHFSTTTSCRRKDATEIRARHRRARGEERLRGAARLDLHALRRAGTTERIDNVEVDRTSRAYPANCTAAIPYSYSGALTGTTNDVKTIVPQMAGVRKT